MFNFNRTTHILRNPKGTISLVGSVPVSLDRKVFQSAGEAVRAIAEAGVTKYCDIPTCACRNTEKEPQQ